MYLAMIYIPLLFACSSSESTKNADSSESTSLDSGVSDVETNTELDDNQEYFGTTPSSQIEVPDFSAQNSDETFRDKDNLIGQPTVLWFFPAAGTYG